MDREAAADDYSMCGKLDPSGFDVETAPNVQVYTSEYINAHPTWLFLYPDMAAPDNGSRQINDAIAKTTRCFVRELHLRGFVDR
eukprot:SAG11_NODE_336_length_10544_cov_9.794926_7_plen_84_part_00